MIGPWNQVLEAKDVATIAVLAVLEGLLSADNALVLAIMVKHLPKDDQKRALLYGLGGAFIFRFLAILFATIVLKQWWLQALGAAYLLFVTVKHFAGAASKKEIRPVKRSFWATVAVVEITDIAFAVDSVLAGITFVGNKDSKIWVVFFGAIVGIVLLRFAASLFIRLLDKYPSLDHVAYLLVGWVGIKLAFISANCWSKLSPVNPHIPHLPAPIFWPVLLAVAGIGGFFAMRRPDPDPPSRTDELEMIENAQEFEFDEAKK
jgi:YkoY family integral membrane protein